MGGRAAAWSACLVYSGLHEKKEYRSLINSYVADGVVHANVEQKYWKRNILLNYRSFLLTDLVFMMLLLVDATNFRNQSPKRSQLY